MLFAAITAASSSCSAAPFILGTMFALAILAPLLAGLVWGRRPGKALDMMVRPVGVFRVARDGRSFLQVGRACVWGRKGETETALRARVSL